MIALTQEKREELIACANEIKKMATSTHGYQVGNDAFGSNALMLMDVALASLTADSAAWVFDDDLQDLKNGYIGNLAANNVEPHIDIPIHRLYTAPPVPEINLPVMKGYTEPHTKYGEGVVDGYNRCLAEIKRLNGLGE